MHSLSGQNAAACLGRRHQILVVGFFACLVCINLFRHCTLGWSEIHPTTETIGRSPPLTSQMFHRPPCLALVFIYSVSSICGGKNSGLQRCTSKRGLSVWVGHGSYDGGGID